MPKDTTPLKYVAYYRKSSDSEDRQVLSIGAQQDEMQKIIDVYKLNVVEHVVETRSAKKEGRPEFSRVVGMLQRGEVNAILCWKPDRLARNMVDGGRIIDMLSQGTIKEIRCYDRMYGSNDNVILLSVEFGQSTQYVKDLSVNVKRGLRNKAKERGGRSGGAALGYLNDMTNEKGNRTWKADPERFPLVEMIFRRFLQGDISAGRLYKWVRNELRLTTPKHKRIGGSVIMRSRLYRMLADPIYAGFFYVDGVRYQLDRKLPRVITEDEHHRVLQLLGGRHIPKTRTHTLTFNGFIRSDRGDFVGPDIKLQVICDCKHKFAYTNRDTCPSCGIRRYEMKHPKYLTYSYYYNISRRRSSAGAKAVSESQITDYVLKYVAENISLPEELAAWSRKYLHELADREIEDARHLIEHRERLREEVDKKKARYRKMLADELLTPEEYRADIASLEVNQLAQETQQAGGQWLEAADDIVDLTQEMLDILANGTTEAKRRILARLGSNLIWDEKKLSIINKKSIQALVDGLARFRAENPTFEPKKYRLHKDKIDAFASTCPSMLPG